MQYVFGDNRSRYAVIYTDTTEQETSRFNKQMINFAIVPDERFNILGYLTYGTNSSNAMFFRIKKDKSIPRSCYYTHAFTRELGHEYYSKKNFEYDMFAQFVEQDEFDAMRDGQKTGCEIGYNTELLAQAQNVSVIDPVVLREVVASLYQKKKVLLAIDDEKYSDDLVRIVVRQIFEYLTPSLKKAVSYLSAVVDTGNADVMLRIVPKSMMADVREAYLDIEGGIAPSTENNIFYKLAECIIGEDGPKWRGLLFNNYEILFHGKDSVYKKQNMEELFLTCIATDRARLEKIVDNFLATSNVTKKEEVTDHVKNNLVPIFAQESELEKRFVFKPEDILDPCALFEENELFIYKSLLYSDIINQFLIVKIARACIDLVLTKSNYHAVKEAIRTVRNKKASEKLNVPETYFYINILLPIYIKYLLPRYNTCVELINKSTELIDSTISPMDPIEKSEKEALKERLTADCAALAAALGDNAKNIDLADFIEESIDDKMFKHNEDHKNGVFDGIPRFPNEDVLEHLAEMDKSLSDGIRFADITEKVQTALFFREQYYFMVDDLLCLYIIKEYKEGNCEDVRSFFDANFDGEDGFSYLLPKLEQFDLSIALCFILDNYRSFDKAISEVLSSIVDKSAVTDAMSAAEAETYSVNLCKALGRFVGSSNEKKDAVIKKLQTAMKNVKKNGNTYKILSAMLCMSKTGKMKKNIVADSTLLNAIIGAAGGVAVVFMIISVLFMTGVFGGAASNAATDDDDDVNASSSSEIADDSGDSEGSGGPEDSGDPEGSGGSEDSGDPEGSGKTEQTGAPADTDGTPADTDGTPADTDSTPADSDNTVSTGE